MFMRLADKLKYLREVEGSLRGLGRAMTQSELVRAIADEMHKPISQSYLSQIESGARPHLTNTTRLLLAKFFKVHPGYLVEDPEGYHAEIISDLRAATGTHRHRGGAGQRGLGDLETKLDLWLIAGSDRFHGDAELCRALRAVAMHDDSRQCVLLLGAILDTPNLANRLLEVLRPHAEDGSATLPASAPVQDRLLAPGSASTAPFRPAISRSRSSRKTNGKPAAKGKTT